MTKVFHSYFIISDCPTSESLGLKKAKNYMARKARNTCRWSTLLNRFPGINFARGYNLNSFVGDLIAGLTTALTVIPQGIGYAPLAGLPLQVLPRVWRLL